MDRILHDVDNAHKILQLTSDTLILVDKNGTCLDIDPQRFVVSARRQTLGEKSVQPASRPYLPETATGLQAGDPTGDNGEPQLPAATRRGRNVLLQMYHAAVRR